ncbi:DUF2254 family protein [Methylobacter sp. G7]|uniref:DUF2254 family protein n=1 Tax=Methylobacter sp. G7 TaxID=3230117 RepID=UPI003D804A89
MSIQASNILAAAAQETIATVDHLFSEGLDETTDEEMGGHLAMFLAEQVWSVIPARKTGYIENVDVNALLALARERGIILCMERGVGEFVVENTSLVSVSGPIGLDNQMTAELNAVYVISRQRTVEQDVAFGIRQIVDVALKALSPGINDRTTAVMCVDYLTAILVRLSVRRIATRLWLDQGELRVIAKGPSFESLLAEAFDQIRQNAKANVAVLTRLLQVLRTISSAHDRVEIEASLGRLSYSWRPFSRDSLPLKTIPYERQGRHQDTKRKHEFYVFVVSKSA